MTVVLGNRYWEKVDVGEPDECWEWTGGLTSGGYGRMRYPSGSSRPELAHVLSYCADRGLDLNDLPSDPSMPDGRRIAVSHHCDFPACINPAHLVVFHDGQAGNNRDKVKKGRHASGDGSNMRTPEGRERAIRVHELRAEHPDWTQKRIGDEVGLSSQQVVSLILSGKRWPEIKSEYRE